MTSSELSENETLIKSSVQKKKPFDPEDEEDYLHSEVRPPFCKYVIEPIVVLMCASSTAQLLVMGQYIYFVVEQQYNNGSRNATIAQQCSSYENYTQPEYRVTQKIQEETTLWNTWINIACGALAIITMPLIAVYSDKLGRKLPLIMFTTAETLKVCVNLLVIYFQWPLWIIIITSLLSGLGGGYGALFSAWFSYIGDISTKRDRAFRIVLVEVVFGISSVATSLFIGYFISLTNGYLMPYIFCTVCAIVCWIYTIAVLPEVRKPSSEKLKVWHQLSQLLRVHTKEDRNTVAVVGLLCALFVYGCSLIGTPPLEQVYEMNFPFCMNSILLGYFSAASMCAMQLGLIISAKFLARYMSVLAIAIVGCISAIGHKLLMGFAVSTPMLMAAPALGIFVLTPIPMIRAHMSIQVPGEEQGALFASIGFIEILCQLVGSFFYNIIYYHTLHFMTGFVFLIMCVTYLITIFLISLVLLCETKNKHLNQNFKHLTSS